MWQGCDWILNSNIQRKQGIGRAKPVHSARLWFRTSMDEILVTAQQVVSALPQSKQSKVIVRKTSRSLFSICSVWRLNQFFYLCSNLTGKAQKIGVNTKAIPNVICQVFLFVHTIFAQNLLIFHYFQSSKSPQNSCWNPMSRSFFMNIQILIKDWNVRCSYWQLYLSSKETEATEGRTKSFWKKQRKRIRTKENSSEISFWIHRTTYVWCLHRGN